MRRGRISQFIADLYTIPPGVVAAAAPGYAGW